MRVDLSWVIQAFRAPHVAPPDRSAPREHHAVVAAILRGSEHGAEVLLIRRSEDERDPWSGHMALPGGHRDPSDADLLSTAVRETLEEIGLDLGSAAELVGRLEGTRAVARERALDFTIYPLVFALSSDFEPALNPKEVAEIVWAPVAHLLSPAAQSSVQYVIRDQRHQFPAFDVDGRKVWGLTYRILQNLLAVVAPSVAAGESAAGGAPSADALRHEGGGRE